MGKEKDELLCIRGCNRECKVESPNVPTENYQEAVSREPDLGTPGSLNPEGKYWEDLQYQASNVAASQYFARYPSETPEDWELNHCREVLGIPQDFLLRAEKSPEDGALVWAYQTRGPMWRLVQYRLQKTGTFHWRILTHDGNTPALEDEDVIGWVPIDTPREPALAVVHRVAWAEAEERILSPLFDAVQRVFPNTSEKDFSGESWEVYAGQDTDHDQIIGHGGRRAAWEMAVAFATSPAGERLRAKMFPGI